METPKKNKPSHDAHLPLCTSQPALNDKKRAPKHHPTLHPQKQKGQPLRGQPLVVPRPPRERGGLFTSGSNYSDPFDFNPPNLSIEYS